MMLESLIASLMFTSCANYGLIFRVLDTKALLSCVFIERFTV
jgi:hypothetical protein